MSNKIDWRDPESLRDISPAQALMVLGEINEVLANRKKATATIDAAEDRRWANLALSASPEAQSFADACNRMGRRMRAAGDCRPELRIRSEERREVLDAQAATAEEDAAGYADSMKQFHRK